MDRKPVCSRCGRDPAPYGAVTLASADGAPPAEIICGRCAAERQAASIRSVDDADELIAETEEQIKIMERIVSQFPQMPPTFASIESVGMTPMSVYRTLQNCLAAYKSRRLELFQTMDREQRLRFELDNAIKAEEYERAAEIKLQLDKP